MTEPQTSRHWDDIHDMWKRENKTDIRAAEMAEAWRILGERIPLAGRFLDVGCGTGGLIAVLAARPGNQMELHGCDFSAIAIEIGLAAQMAGSVTLTVADAEEPLPYPDGHFDVTFCGHIIEHLADPVPLLRDMRRVTKPNGMIVVEFPYDDPPYPEHVHEMLNYEKVAAWVEAAGIQVVECLPVVEMQPTNDGVIIGRRV